MWFLDFPTLVLVIAAGLQAGLQAVFGLDAAATLFGVTPISCFASWV